MVQVITTPKLSEKGFIINDTGSGMILEPRLNQDPNNQLQLTETGFLVPKISPQSFVLQPTNNVRMTEVIAIKQIASDGLPLWWVPNTKTIYTDGRVTKNRRIIFHSVGVFH